MNNSSRKSGPMHHDQRQVAIDSNLTRRNAPGETEQACSLLDVGTIRVHGLDLPLAARVEANNGRFHRVSHKIARDEVQQTRIGFDTWRVGEVCCCLETSLMSTFVRSANLRRFHATCLGREAQAW